MTKKKPSHVGLKRAHLTSDMPYEKRIDCIYESLPLVLERAQKPYADANILQGLLTNNPFLITFDNALPNHL